VSLSLRDSWQEAWLAAVELAVGALQQSDVEERCSRSGARWLPADGAAELPFLDRVYRVLLPAFEVVGAADVDEVPLTTRILLLHYLSTATGAPLTGEWISFAQVPGGDLYLQNFRARSVDRVVRSFAGRETALVEAAVAIGGGAAGFGDVSVQVSVLPRVPVALVLWRGDEEFSPAGNLLFDAAVTEYLPVEDMVVLAGMTVSRICR
jgi:hypothetical protein